MFEKRNNVRSGKNQKEMIKLVALIAKNSSVHENAQDSHSETENISVPRTSTSVKTNTTTSITAPMNSRNIMLARNRFQTKNCLFDGTLLFQSSLNRFLFEERELY